MIVWLVGWLIAWLVAWLVACLLVCLVGCLLGGCFVGWLASSSGQGNRFLVPQENMLLRAGQYVVGIRTVYV